MIPIKKWRDEKGGKEAKDKEKESEKGHDKTGKPRTKKKKERRQTETKRETNRLSPQATLELLTCSPNFPRAPFKQ